VFYVELLDLTARLNVQQINGNEKRKRV